MPVDDDTTATITISVSDDLLEGLDTMWREEGYLSQDAFVAEALRDAVEHPELTRESLTQIASVEHDRRTDDSEVYTREAVLADE